jgi:hypothetical protein
MKYSITYAKRKAAGLCVRCGNTAKPGRTRCEVCTEITADYVAGRRSLFIVKGLCDRCGRRPPRKNSLTCMECALKNAERKKARP